MQGGGQALTTGMSSAIDFRLIAFMTKKHRVWRDSVSIMYPADHFFPGALPWSTFLCCMLFFSALFPCPLRGAVPLESSGEPAFALAYFREQLIQLAGQLADDFPENANALGLAGNLYLQAGNQDAAANAWEAATAISPESAHGFYAMAQIAFQKEDHSRAAELLHRVLNLDPQFPNAHCQLGETFLLMGAFDQAQRFLEDALEQEEDPYRPAFFLGQLHMERMDYSSAAHFFQQALNLRPNDPEACYGLSRALILSGKQQEAERYLKLFQEMKRLEIRSDRSQRASYDDWNRMRESYARALADVAGFYSRREQLDQAGPIWRMIARLVPESYVPWLNLGAIQVRLRQWTDAEQNLEKACDLAPAEAAAFKFRLQALMNLPARDEDLLTCAQRLAALSPTAEHFLILGQIQFRTGNRQGAIETLSEAAEMAPENQTIQDLLMRIERSAASGSSE